MLWPLIFIFFIQLENKTITYYLKKYYLYIFFSFWKNISSKPENV